MESVNPNVRVRVVLRILARTRFVAVTYPPFGIFIRKAWWESASVERRESLLRHEQAHWAQYERYGLIGFYARYIFYSLRYGYRNHPMEIEARAAAKL